MIAYIKGKIILINGNFLILETGGIGRRVQVSAKLSFMPGETVELFIHEHIREDADDLYGFGSFDELDLFEKLISVNGVGPKAGLNIMSSGASDEVRNAIASENIAFFKAISGIGQKAATKIILDLKSKVTNDKNISDLLGKSSESDDIFDALMALGYQRKEISILVSKIPVGIIIIEEKVRWCLQNLAK